MLETQISESRKSYRFRSIPEPTTRRVDFISGILLIDVMAVTLSIAGRPRNSGPIKSRISDTPFGTSPYEGSVS